MSAALNTIEIDKNMWHESNCRNYTFKKDFSSSGSKTYDFKRIMNLDKIDKMSRFEENWNGNGGLVFSDKALEKFKSIIYTLKYQPEIAPTGRNSLYMEYDFKDNSILAYEVKEDIVEQVYVPGGDFSRSETTSFNENISEHINKRIGELYESGNY